MPSIHLAEQKKAIESEFAPLIGATVVSAGAILDDDGNCWPVVRFRTADGRLMQLELSSDEEGNGPGHPFIGEIES
jgi:hypothetical protein